MARANQREVDAKILEALKKAAEENTLYNALQYPADLNIQVPSVHTGTEDLISGDDFFSSLFGSPGIRAVQVGPVTKEEVRQVYDRNKAEIDILVPR